MHGEINQEGIGLIIHRGYIHLSMLKRKRMDYNGSIQRTSGKAEKKKSTFHQMEEVGNVKYLIIRRNET